jgi:hypothetical protein
VFERESECVSVGGGWGGVGEWVEGSEGLEMGAKHSRAPLTSPRSCCHAPFTSPALPFFLFQVPSPGEDVQTLFSPPGTLLPNQLMLMLRKLSDMHREAEREAAAAAAALGELRSRAEEILIRHSLLTHSLLTHSLPT